MKTIEALVEEFISGAEHFYDDLDLKNIDNKHSGIVNSAYKQFEGEISIKNFRNWKRQSDLMAPFQLSIDMFKHYGVLNLLTRYIYYKIFWRERERNTLSAMLDDVEIIKLIGGNDYLLDNPVHKTPGADVFYQADGASYNIRWLRYIYATARIIDNKLLKDGDTWVDIGSYYGGLQGIIKKYQPKTKLVLIDFHHQLCRSFIYLSTLFPDVNHVLPNKIRDYSDLTNLPDGSIAYVPTSSFSLIKNCKVALATNLFSFGEMRREIFNDYFESNIFKQSKKTYLVNRFVSSPFFESTYDSDINVNDYQSADRIVDYFDVFPIHHYALPYRELFGRKHSRNTSSSYFEMITSKHN